MAVLRVILFIEMGLFLIGLVRRPHAVAFFFLYTLMGMAEIILFRSPHPREYWVRVFVPVETVGLVVLVCASWEAFRWLVDELRGEQELKALLLALFGFAVSMAVLFKPPIAVEDSLDLLNFLRDMLHAGLCGFLTVAVLYVWLAKPLPAERFTALHCSLLAVLMGAHAVSRPLGRYMYWKTAHIFLPTAVAIYLGWDLLMLLPVRLNAPRYVFGTPRVRGPVEAGDRVSLPS